jgi:Family of unknown function (DUF6228)
MDEVRMGLADHELTLAVGEVGPDGEVWSLDVGLTYTGLSAQTNVWLGPPGVQQWLDEFFGELAQEWRGWHEPKEWVGMEGGLRLRATHDGLAYVNLEVELMENSGSGWSVSAVVPVDLGQLDDITAAIRDLLGRTSPV